MKRVLRYWVIAAVALSLVLLAAAAFARPGGGGSYSGGSSHGSGGGGGFSSSSGGYSGGGGSSGGGDGIAAMVLLAIEHPYIGIPLILIVIIIYVVKQRSSGVLSGDDWSSGANAAGWSAVVAGMAGQQPQQQQQQVTAANRGGLEALRRTDPGFSVVVFEDFLYFLYAEMHRARGAGHGDTLAAYVADHARAMLANDGRVAEVTGIIIGGLTYESVQIDASGAATVEVTVESNYVERYRPQGEQRYYVKERLTLTRAAGARSRDPGKARTLNCPNCGGPLSNMRGITCGFCQATVPQGSKDWAIAGIRLIEREARGPLLTSNVEEEGTRLPTIMDQNAQAKFAAILAKDPQGTSWQTLQQRVGLVFQEFHAGWVGRDPTRVRPFVSDNLFQSQLYWIDLYRTSHCINRTDGSRITQLELANATTDAYYDAVTIRLYATGLDFTIGEDGKLLSGSQSKPRAYSEYWTLIRGAQKKRTDKGERQCPNCGAPLKINMTGNCEYCQVKVTSGEYDWVLSRIEQDEAYTG